MSDADSWKRIRAVFDGAAALDARDRPGFLDRECGADRALRERVAALLAAHDRAATFLEAPAHVLIDQGRR
jgi:hypothetical protein